MEAKAHYSLYQNYQLLIATEATRGEGLTVESFLLQSLLSINGQFVTAAFSDQNKY